VVYGGDSDERLAAVAATTTAVAIPVKGIGHICAGQQTHTLTTKPVHLRIKYNNNNNIKTAEVIIFSCPLLVFVSRAGGELRQKVPQDCLHCCII